MLVITLSGKAESGKDYSAKFIKEFWEQKGRKVLIIHYADYLKYVCKQYFGWNGEKDIEGRALLQHVGTDVAREKLPNIWVDVVVNFIKAFGEEYDFVLIPDCRFPNEIECIKESFPNNSVSVNVIRLNHTNILTEEQKNHPSETALDNYTFDCVITSENGIDHLKREITGFNTMLEFYYN